MNIGLSSLPVIFLLFAISLIITMAASAWFTRRLETICAKLALPLSLLSLLGALAANIPNYAASIDAIASGRTIVGLGIIIGSNIYNVAIILSISALAAPHSHGISLEPYVLKDVRTVGGLALAIMLTTLLEIWLLPETRPVIALQVSFMGTILLFACIFLTLGIFVALALHALRRVRHSHYHVSAPLVVRKKQRVTVSLPLIRLALEALIALAIALGGVVVMVQSGQALTGDLHLPQVLAGLLVLAVATSLPNTVVVFSLARDGRGNACVEEIFSSNSINATLGIALPLLFWHAAFSDRFLLFLDAPLMAVLTLSVLLLVYRKRVGRVTAIVLLLIYAAWVTVQMIV